MQIDFPRVLVKSIVWLMTVQNHAGGSPHYLSGGNSESSNTAVTTLILCHNLAFFWKKIISQHLFPKCLNTISPRHCILSLGFSGACTWNCTQTAAHAFICTQQPVIIRKQEGFFNNWSSGAFCSLWVCKESF